MPLEYYREMDLDDVVISAQVFGEFANLLQSAKEFVKQKLVELPNNLRQFDYSTITIAPSPESTWTSNDANKETPKSASKTDRYTTTANAPFSVSSSSSTSHLNVVFGQKEPAINPKLNDWLNGVKQSPSASNGEIPQTEHSSGASAAGKIVTQLQQPPEAVKTTPDVDPKVSTLSASTPSVPRAVPELPSTFGTITSRFELIPGGIQAMVTSTNNALNIDVSVGFQITGVDTLIDDLVNRMMGHYVVKTVTVNAYGDPFSLELSHIGGITHLKNMKVRAYYHGKKEAESRFKLKKLDVSSHKNTGRINEGLNEALKKAITSVFTRRAGEFTAKLRDVLQNKDYDRAQQLTNQFYGRYHEMPGMNERAELCRSEIRKMQSSDLFQAGKDLLAEGNNEAALTKFLASQQADPGNIAAAFEMAQIASKQGNLDEAITQMKIVAASDASFNDYLGMLQKTRDMFQLLDQGERLQTEHQFAQAKALYEKAHEIIPEHDAPTLALVKLHEESGDLPAAIKQIEPIANKETRYAEHLAMLKNNLAANYIDAAHELASKGNLVEAKELCQKAQALVPEHEAPTYLIAQLYERLGNLPAAIVELEKISGKNELAKHYMQVLRSLNTANICTDMASTLLDNGDEQGAIAKLREAQTYVPNHAAAAFALASIYANQSEFGQAIEEIEKIPKNPISDGYIAQLRICRSIAIATPFLQTLAQFSEEYLQSERLGPYSDAALKVLTAIHYLHPQALIALPDLIAGNELMIDSWSAVLQQRLSSPLFLTTGVLARYARDGRCETHTTT